MADQFHPAYKPPPTRSVTVFLEDMGGVAYTTGTDLDNDHKEIRTYISAATYKSQVP